MGSILFYAWAVDNATLKSLNIITQHTANATKLTEQWATQFLDYLATHHTATISYWASNMVLLVHSNVSYLNKSQAHSSYAGYFFCGDNQHDNKPLNLNRVILINASILKLVVASAVEKELETLFNNSQSVQELQLSLSEMGWPQKATDIICNNTTADGIANSMIKHQHSWAMNMRYFWIID